MTAKGIDPFKKKDSNKNSFSEGEIALRKDLTSEKMVWTGRICTDFWYFVMSQHAIFSWFCCPPFCGVPKQHPYSWKERICVLLIGLCWALIWKAAEISSEGTDETDKSFDVKLAEAITGLLVTMMAGINAAFATCSCVQGSKTRTRTWCERIGCILVTLNLLFAAICASAMIYDASNNEYIDILIVAMITSNIYSWFGWDILFCIIQFFVGWFSLCKYKKNYFKQRSMGRAESKLSVHWKDYAYYYDPKTKGNPKYAPQHDDMRYDLLRENPTIQEPIYIQEPVQAIQEQPVYLQQPGQQAIITYIQPQGVQPVYLQQSGQQPTYYINVV